MKVKTFFPLFLLSGSLFAENLLPDASFELGGTDYSMQRYAEITEKRQHKYIAPVCDPENPVHGKVSLRFDNPFGQSTGLRSPDFDLRDDTTYTFSFYARSSKPVKLRAMIFAVVCKDENRRNGEWDNGNYKFFVLTPEWKRYSITFTPKKGFRSYLADLMWGEKSDAVVWLDALMISCGKTPSPFVPKSQVEFTLNSTKHCRIEGEPSLSYTLSGINYGKRDVKAEVSLREFDDYRNKPLGERKLELEIPAGKTIRRTLAADRKQFGTYSVRGDFRINGKTETIWPYLYSVVGKYNPGKTDPGKDFLLGSEESFGFDYPDINGGKSLYHLKETDLEEYERLARNRGIRLLRLGNGVGFFKWKDVEPEPGKFNFSLADFVVDRALQQNYFILGVLGNVLLERFLPQWAVQRSSRCENYRIMGNQGILPNSDDWRRYVANTVRHFKGRIKYWEVLNEANLTTPPEDYVKLLKIAFEECRKIDPAIRVVAPNVTGDHGGIMTDFLERFGKAGGFQYTDIVSFHPYSSREENSPNPSRSAIHTIKTIIAGYRKDLPLWNTELYYLYDNPPHPVYAGRGRAYHFSRRLLLDLGEGIRQETLLPDGFSFRLDRNPGYGYLVSRVVRRLIPSEFYVAGNAFARFMEGAAPVTRLETPRGVTIYVYRQRDGKPIAAMWNFSGKQQFDISFADPEEIRLFDLFGNPVKHEKVFRIQRDPVYIKGKKDAASLLRSLKASRITAETGFEITRARYFVKDGAPAVAVEFRSSIADAQDLRVRLLSAPEAKAAKPGSSMLRLAPGKTSVILLPIAVKQENKLKSGSVKLMVYDGKTTKTFTVPIEGISLLRNGNRVTLNTPDRLTYGKAEKYNRTDSSVTFSAVADAEFFNLKFRVRDSRRGKYLPQEPWNMDCLELFFDRSPLADVERREHTKDVFRLFFCPAAEGKEAFLKGQGSINIKDLRWNIQDTADGYMADLSVPWKTLRLVPGSPVSFDVSLDNNDGTGRVTQLTWSGTSKNHLHRHCFGVWVK